MTAAKLLESFKLAGCHPIPDGAGLYFEADLPPELERYLEVLLTGVRALVIGKRWVGIDRATGRAVGPYPARSYGPLAFGCLDPASTLPRNVGLLIVEGQREKWDRLPPWAIVDFPECFEPPP